MSLSEHPYDPSEVFSAEEIGEAARLRRMVSPDTAIRRRDHCPHVPPCPSVRVCLEEIAWYRRHQRDIEARCEALERER